MLQCGEAQIWSHVCHVCSSGFRLSLGRTPLEAILVIFGRWALIFFVWKLMENMKNNTTFVRMRSGDHLGDAKMSEKGTSLRRI